MNDLFRRDPPRMSDEEDRRTWERVRTAATRPVPWWSVLWARPAVRFGLPAVAVVLVAVVWIAVEQPASTRRPARQSAALEQAPGGSAGAPEATAPAEPAPSARLLVVPAPGKEPGPAPKPEARDLDALRKKFAVAPAPSQLQAPLHDEAAAGKPAANAPGASIDVKEEKAQARREVTALRAGVREATSPVAPTPAAPAPALGAPAAAGNALAPKDKASAVAGSTFGVMKQTSKGDSLAVNARGGRSDELAYRYVSSTTLELVGPLVSHRPLRFTAPLPVVTSAGAKAPETARIELSAQGVVSARVVDGAGGANEPSVEGAPGQTYARFEDAAPAEQILLVAYAADRMAGGAPPSLVQRLLVQAQRLEARDDDEQAAAKALLARLKKKNWGGAAWR